MEWEQSTPVDWIKGEVRNSVKAPDYDNKVLEFEEKVPELDKKVPEPDNKHLKKAGGHIGWNVMYINLHTVV